MGEGNDYYRMVGAGEYILYAAGDPANFAKDWMVAPPGVMEKNFTEVVKYLAGLGWPFRQHATFDSTAARQLDVLEAVNREVPLKNLRWGLDHCETLTPKTLERVAKLGGSISIQNRMSLDGEAFVAKYGAQAASDAPPIARIREMGIPLACGTDANRATSYNPWIGVHWLLTGKTLGGAKLQGEQQPARPHRGAAPLHRGRRLDLVGGRQEGHARGRQARRPGGAERRLLLHAGRRGEGASSRC